MCILFNRWSKAGSTETERHLSVHQAHIVAIRVEGRLEKERLNIVEEYAGADSSSSSLPQVSLNTK